MPQLHAAFRKGLCAFLVQIRSVGMNEALFCAAQQGPAGAGFAGGRALANLSAEIGCTNAKRQAAVACLSELNLFSQSEANLSLCGGAAYFL
jgi:hypothetical protein